MKHVITLTLILLFCVSGLFAQEKKDNGKFSGVVFYEWTYNPDNDGMTNEFELHRSYFTYQRQLDENLKYKFQVDVGRTSNDDRLFVYLKNAKVDWKQSFGTITLGLQGLNVFNIQEKTWGYRFIEKSAMDKYKFSSSADLGIGYATSFNKKVHVSGIVSNGRGYKHAENDSYKKVSVQALYGQKKLSSKDGFNFGGVFTYEPYEAGKDTTENKAVVGVFGGFAKGAFRVGAEFDQMSNSGTDIAARIISAYATFKFHKKAEAFARFDMYDPNTDTDKDGKNYIVAGAVVKPAKGLYVAPTIKHTSPETGDATTSYNLNFQIKF